MRLLKAIGKMLACVAGVCVLIGTAVMWATFCARFGGLRGELICVAPGFVLAMVFVTRIFYKGQL